MNCDECIRVPFVYNRTVKLLIIGLCCCVGFIVNELSSAMFRSTLFIQMALFAVHSVMIIWVWSLVNMDVVIKQTPGTQVFVISYEYGAETFEESEFDTIRGTFIVRSHKLVFMPIRRVVVSYTTGKIGQTTIRRTICYAQNSVAIDIVSKIKNKIIITRS